jgi:hypothetical protein
VTGFTPEAVRRGYRQLARGHGLVLDSRPRWRLHRRKTR